MRVLIPTLFSLASAERAMNGWSINCKIDTGEDSYGPMFLMDTRTFNSELDIYWSSAGRGDGGIYGNGPFGVNSDATACMSVANNVTSPKLIDAPFLTYPNALAEVPFRVYGSTGFIAIPQGFASVSTFDGCIAIANMNQPWSSYPVTSDNIQIITGGCGTSSVVATKYYYHAVKWFDMDGDGYLDVLTAQAESKTDPTQVTSSNLVWFKNPGTNSTADFMPGANKWQSYVITAGADLADTYLDVFQNGKNIVVVTGGFSSQTLAIIQGPTGSWGRNQNSIKKTIIDKAGIYYGQQFADIDQDGVFDVIATIGSYGEQQGKLVVYKGSVSTGNSYSVQSGVVVYDQFPVFSSAGVGSPGEASIFWFDSIGRTAEQYPSILVSGNDDGNMYLFTPNMATSGMFGDYTFNQIYQSSAFNPFVTPLTAPTVGKQTVVDMNEDGCNEIVVANYANKQLVVLEQNSYTACKRPNPTLPPRPTLPPKPTLPPLPTHRPNNLE